MLTSYNKTLYINLLVEYLILPPVKFIVYQTYFVYFDIISFSVMEYRMSVKKAYEQIEGDNFVAWITHEILFCLSFKYLHELSLKCHTSFIDTCIEEVIDTYNMMCLMNNGNEFNFAILTMTTNTLSQISVRTCF